MEKKNTILLTVIAIVTLLVAVVGATFAYYSVQYQNSTSTTTFTGTANPVGAITLTTPVNTLLMTITPTDMASNFAQKSFYAIPSASSNEASSNSTNGIYGTSRKRHQIALASLVGGYSETAYTCNATLTVTTSGSMASLLQAGDAYLYLEGEQATITGGETTLDLSTIKSKTQTYSIVYKVNGLTNENRLAHIYADIELKNTSADQSYLAGDLSTDKSRPGTTLIVEIKSTSFNCTIDNQKATA